jgi:hypothetical protein
LVVITHAHLSRSELTRETFEPLGAVAAFERIRFARPAIGTKKMSAGPFVLGAIRRCSVLAKATRKRSSVGVSLGTITVIV